MAWVKHIPNAITASRGLAGFPIAWLVLEHEANLAAFWLYIAAIATDLVDGAIARKLDAQSSTGLWLDPVSDKVLANTTWIALWTIGWAPWWIAGVILARDVAVVLAWLWLRSRGIVGRPNMVGRLATSFEGVALPVLLLHQWWLGVHWMTVGVMLGGITLALSLASSVQYAVGLLRRTS